MPPQAIASPIPTVQAAPKVAANDPRTAPRPRTIDGGRAGDAPAQRNDRAATPKERSSFDEALDRARKADEAQAQPAIAVESHEPAQEPTDAAPEPAPRDHADAETDAPTGATGEVENAAPVQGEVVNDDAAAIEVPSEGEAADSQAAVTTARAEEPRPQVGAGVLEARSAEIQSAQDAWADESRPRDGVAQPKNDRPQAGAQSAQTREGEPNGEQPEAPVKTDLPRGNAKVERTDSGTPSPSVTDEVKPERAERAVRLSERIVPEGDEPAPRVRDNPSNGERVGRSETATVFVDADAATESPDVEPRPVPETQPARVERPVITRERPATDQTQQAAIEGEAEAPVPASPGAVQAANAGVRLSGDDQGAQERRQGATERRSGVERFESAGRAPEPTTANATGANGAHEPRGVGESRASAANLAQARPEAKPHEQATVHAANRGLDVALKQQGGSVQLRLAPESLGALKVEMTIARGVVSATLQASTPEARELLTRNIETLRSSLEAKGLSVERLSITLAPASQGGSSGQSFNTNSGPQSQHQPAPGTGGQQTSDHDAGGERSKGFFEHHERNRQGQQSSKDDETDERLFKYRMGLHTIA